MQKHPMTNEYANGIIGFRYDILLCLTNEPLVGYEVLMPLTNQFVFAFVFVFVLAHEQAISTVSINQGMSRIIKIFQIFYGKSPMTPCNTRPELGWCRFH